MYGHEDNELSTFTYESNAFAFGVSLTRYCHIPSLYFPFVFIIDRRVLTVIRKRRSLPTVTMVQLKMQGGSIDSTSSNVTCHCMLTGAACVITVCPPYSCFRNHKSWVLHDTHSDPPRSQRNLHPYSFKLGEIIHAPVAFTVNFNRPDMSHVTSLFPASIYRRTAQPIR
ncbi:hypothetical protein M378DRAFT_291888 [Amanita muscaria Koide BX008]|uniref:Uncharacterized protein n=1 Tax=Amanita muscaria (strain Koide BX008) TaxID=946122 RepID=A0A0C2WRC5_AMAMK|nr:hypothetical protein M378DRAFT_291888 [Amanita muscaria Koide BX008]